MRVSVSRCASPHPGQRRKDIRTYAAGDRHSGARARAVTGPSEVFSPYYAQRPAFPDRTN